MKRNERLHAAGNPLIQPAPYSAHAQRHIFTAGVQPPSDALAQGFSNLSALVRIRTCPGWTAGSDITELPGLTLQLTAQLQLLTLQSVDPFLQPAHGGAAGGGGRAPLGGRAEGIRGGGIQGRIACRMQRNKMERNTFLLSKVTAKRSPKTIQHPTSFAGGRKWAAAYLPEVNVNPTNGRWWPEKAK